MSKNWKEEIDKARENKEIVYLPNYFVSKFTWDDIINEAENASKQEGFLVPRHTDMRGYFQYIMAVPSNYKYIDDIMQKFAKEIAPEELVWPSFIQVFSNLISENYITTKHRDNWNGLFIQVLGQVKWEVYLDKEVVEPKQSIIVNPGDLILVPSGVLHKVTALTPRASINMAFPSEFEGFYNKYEEDGEV